MQFIDKQGNVLKANCSGKKLVDLKKVKLEDEEFSYEGKTLVPDLFGKGAAGQIYRFQNDDVHFVWKWFYTENAEQDLQEELNAYKLLETMDASTCRVLHEGRERSGGIIMQMMDGSMDEFMGRMHPDGIVQLCISVAKSLQCLWKKSIVYTDVKPANILYKCNGNGTFDIVLGDVGDIRVFFPGNNSTKDYVETFAYPYIKERLDFKKPDEVDYGNLIGPLTTENAEDHMVWAVACLFFVMLKPMTVIKYLSHNRMVSRDDFVEKRQEMAGLLQKDPFQQNKTMLLLGKALVDPTSVRLAEIINEFDNDVGTKTLVGSLLKKK